jgi:hypothetical protein
MTASSVARLPRIGVLVLAGSFVVAAAAAQDPAGMKMSTVTQSAEWQQIKSLVGEWEGETEFDGKKTPIAVEMRLTGDGSAVMHIQGKGTPYEMVTMIHPDGDRILATHYCAAHNQPRMALVKGGNAKQLTFDYVDGTNIRAGDMHMKRLVLNVKDADHHDEVWTSMAGGKETPPHVFSYSRKK